MDYGLANHQYVTVTIDLACSCGLKISKYPKTEMETPG